MCACGRMESERPSRRYEQKGMAVRSYAEAFADKTAAIPH